MFKCSRKIKRTMATRPYQGYPYSNPHVTDAPTVDAATASRWNNLPRRPIQPSRGNVVYVPEDSQRPNEEQTDKKEPDPVIYIDVPDSGNSEVAGPASVPETVHYDRRRINDTSNPFGKKSESEPDPVIYIDVPDGNSSDVASPRPPESEPVHETIFYDPFDDRRIDQQKPDGPDSPSGPGPLRPAPAVPRPTPPRTLDLHGAGSSGYPSTVSSPNASNYGRHNDEGFQRPREPYDYPEPPPSYSEIHTPQTPPMSPQTPHTPQTPSTETAPQEPPRTVVITRGPELNRPPSDELPSPIGLASADRKVIYCHHCGLRVHTLVIWQSGLATHVIAFVLICLMLLPLVVLLYWTNFFKYRNHYCPNCNKKIGYEVPALCIAMTYTT